MTVVREDRVITIAEQGGMRGRDGVDGADGADGATSLLVSAEVANSGSFWTLTPDLPVVALGADQIFFGIAPSAHSGSALNLRILGINDGEERVVKLADGTTSVLQSQVPAGASFAVRYNTVSGVMQLIWPAVASGAGGGALVPCDVVNSTTYWTVTPDDDVVALGADQIFFGIAPAAHSGSALNLRILGINDAEERVVKLADGTTSATPAQVPEGASFAVRYNTVSGVMQLIWPAVASTVGQAVIRCDITGTPNALILTPLASYTADASGRQTYCGYASAANTGAISADVIGLTNGDVRQVRLPGGVDQVPAGLITLGAYVEIAYLAGGLFELVHPSPGATSSGSLTTYQRVEARRSADNAAKAATLARRALL